MLSRDRFRIQCGGSMIGIELPWYVEWDDFIFFDRRILLHEEDMGVERFESISTRSLPAVVDR